MTVSRAAMMDKYPCQDAIKTSRYHTDVAAGRPTIMALLSTEISMNLAQLTNEPERRVQPAARTEDAEARCSSTLGGCALDARAVGR